MRWSAAAFKGYKEAADSNMPQSELRRMWERAEELGRKRPHPSYGEHQVKKEDWEQVLREWREAARAHALVQWSDEAKRLREKALRSDMPAELVAEVAQRAEELARDTDGARVGFTPTVRAREWYQARHECGARAGEWIEKPAQLSLFDQQPQLWAEAE